MSDAEQQVDEEIDEDLIYQQMYQAIEEEIHVEFGSEETPNLDALNLTQNEIEVIRKQGIAAFKEIMLAKFRQNNQNNDEGEEEGSHSPKSIQCEEGWKHNDESMNKGRDNMEDGEAEIAENHDGQEGNSNAIKNQQGIKAEPQTQVAEQTEEAVAQNNTNLETTGLDIGRNARFPAGTVSDKANAAGKINLKIGFALSLKTKFQKGETITENERLGKIPSEKVLKTSAITDKIQETSCNTDNSVKDITIAPTVNCPSADTQQKQQSQQYKITDQPPCLAVEAANSKISASDNNEASRDDSKALTPLGMPYQSKQSNDAAEAHLKSEIINNSLEEKASVQKESEGNKEGAKIALAASNNTNACAERNADAIEKGNNKNQQLGDKVIQSAEEQSLDVKNAKEKEQQTQGAESVAIAAAVAENNSSAIQKETNPPAAATTASIPPYNSQSLVTQVSFSAILPNPATQSEQQLLSQQQHIIDSTKQSQMSNIIAVNASRRGEPAARNGHSNQGVEDRSKNTLSLMGKDILLTPKKAIIAEQQLTGNTNNLKVSEYGNSSESQEISDKHKLAMWGGDISEVSPIKKQQQQYQLEESLNLSQPPYQQQSQSDKVPSRQQQQPQQPKKSSTPVLANNVRQLQLSGVKVSQMKMIAPIGQQSNYDSEINRYLQDIQQASVDLSQGNQHLNEECVNLSNHISQLHASQMQNYSSPLSKSRGQNYNNSSSASHNNRVCSPKQQEDAVASIYRRHQEAQDRIKKMKDEKDKREEALITKKAVYLSKTSEKILAKKQYVKLETRSTALAKSVTEKRKQQLEEKLKASEEAELQQCTFKPELISKNSSDEPFLTLDEASQTQQLLQQQYQSNGSNISTGSNYQRQYDEFFARQIAWTQRKRNEIMSNQIQQMEKEKTGLTFHPNINKVSEEQVRSLRVEDRLLQDFERLLDKKKALEEESQPLFRPVILPHSNQLAKQRKQRINMSNQLSNYHSTL